jgi:hypothetical protein
MGTTLFPKPDAALKTLREITVSLPDSRQRPGICSSFVPSVLVHGHSFNAIRESRFAFPPMSAVLTTHGTGGRTMRHLVNSFADHPPNRAYRGRCVVKYRRCSRQVFDAPRAAVANGEQDGREVVLLEGKEKEYRADPKAITIPSGFKESGIQGFKQEEKNTWKELLI